MEGGFVSELVKRINSKTAVKVGGTLTLITTLLGMTGCADKIESHATQAAEAVDRRDKYAEATIVDGNAAGAYIGAYEQYLITVDGRSPEEAKDIASGLFDEYMPTSNFPTIHPILITEKGVNAYDSHEALYRAVDDRNPNTTFSDELNAVFPNGMVIVGSCFDDMKAPLTFLKTTDVQASVTRWDPVQGLTTFNAAEAFTNMGIGE